MDKGVNITHIRVKSPSLAQAISQLRQDHRPYLVKRWLQAIERAYVRAFIAPHLDALGEHALMMKPWRLKIHGPNIRIGRSVHVVTATTFKTHASRLIVLVRKPTGLSTNGRRKHGQIIAI